jgi:hypothetical protein
VGYFYLLFFFLTPQGLRGKQLFQGLGFIFLNARFAKLNGGGVVMIFRKVRWVSLVYGCGSGC